MEVDDFVERVEVSCISIPFCEVYYSMPCHHVKKSEGYTYERRLLFVEMGNIIVAYPGLSKTS